MKKGLLFFASTLFLVFTFLILNKENKSDIDNLKAQHKLALENSPFKTTKNLSKEDRKAKGLPPNAYYERMWELTLDPNTGRPMPERLYALQKELILQREISRGVGGDANNAWIERGPNNQGGRTRAIMYDPNDGTNKRVFAGGVSGGLWVNNDITDVNSSWTEVNLPQNLSVSSIVYDPNNTMTFYLGTGESYVGGAVNGNGLWKSVDGGVNWERIFGGATANGEGAIVTVNSPGSIAGDYTAIQAAFGLPLTSITGDLVLVDDSTGLPTEGCNSLTNGGAVSGNIAVIERGSCSFALKVKNAENAGAIAVLVINNAAGAPIIMGGGDYTIYIPAVMISQADGQTILAEIGNNINITIEPDVTPSSGSFSSGGVQHINDIAIRDVGSTSEIYVAAAAAVFADANPTGFIGTGAYGLYKSTDDGTTWTLLTLPSNGLNSDIAPNDIEIAQDNDVWISTTRSLVATADPGGQVLSSSDGTTFTLEYTVTNGRRTQIAVSVSDPDKIYVLAQLTSGTNGVEIVLTDDAFSTQTSLTLPNDVDTGIPSTDFTRGQSFYDLMLEVDPTNDAIVYVGGVDIFRSSNSGTSWSQFSKWSNNNNLAALNVPLVHADQHAFVFDPSDATKAVIGNDGGVFYATTLSGTQVINSRNKDYNTVQFYNGTIDPVDGGDGDDLIGGTQDNGTQFVQDAMVGINGFFDPVGGDGGYTEIDDGGAYMIQSYPQNTHRYIDYPILSSAFTITTPGPTNNPNGSFINEAELDKNLDILYSNGSVGSTYRIERVADFFPGLPTIDKSFLSDALLNASPTAFKVSPFTLGSTKLFLGLDNGRLLRVDNADGTDTWTNITGGSFIGSVSDIEFGETESDIFVTMHNYGVISIWFSDDAGSSWTSIEGDLPDLPVKCILQNTLIPNELIIGTDLGVWSTEDYTVASPVWVQSFNGMKDTKVVDLDVRTSDDVILATTFGRGFFTSQFTSTPLVLDDNHLVSNSIKVFPTVSNGTFSILSKSSLGNVNMDLFTITGQKVYNSTFQLSNVKKNFNLSLSSGLYLISIQGNNFKITKRIIIE